MSEEREIKIKYPDGSETSALLKIVQAEGEVHLLLDDRKFGAIEAVGNGAFDALKKIRLNLEAKGVRILCAGARKDLFTSGMSRSMGGGRKAYLLKMGEPAKMDSLVDIFDSAPVETVGTVDEQQRFYNDWIDSISRLK